jgi:hypothetical protein
MWWNWIKFRFMVADKMDLTIKTDPTNAQLCWGIAGGQDPATKRYNALFSFARPASSRTW